MTLMKKLKHLFLLFALIPLHHGLAQQSVVTATLPHRLESVNTEDLEEAAPLLSPDGKRLYFTRTRQEVTNGVFHEIWYADLEGAGALVQKKAPKPLNSDLNSAVVGVSATGNILYLFGTYNKLFEDQKGLSYSSFENNKWLKPSKIDIPKLNISGGFYGLYVHPEGKVVIVSKGNAGDEDLFVSTRNELGKWSEPLPLGPTINTHDFEISPFLSFDQKHLFFSRGGKSMNTDIYFSERLDESWTSWSVPQKLPSPINSDGFDAYFSILEDSTVVFSSNRSGSSDIYMSRLISTKIQPAAPEQPLQAFIPPEPILTEPEIVQAEPQVVSLAEKYLFFNSDQYEIASSQKVVLDQIANRLLQSPDEHLEIAGHTDSVNTEDYNQRLSDKRAEQVLNYLMEKGVSRANMSLVAYGELMPIANNRRSKGRRLNRRVKLVINTRSS